VYEQNLDIYFANTQFKKIMKIRWEYEPPNPSSGYAQWKK